MSSWQIVLLEPARTVLGQIGMFLVNILLVLILMIIGWLVSRGIKTLVTNGLRAMKLDELSDRIELEGLLEKGGISYSLSELIGIICYWLALLVTVVVALSPVGLITPGLVDKVVSYIPNVVLAIFILIVGMFIATLLKNIVLTAAGNVGLRQGVALGKIVEIIVVIFAALMSLEQLGIGVTITEVTLSVILGSVGLAMALAFGLGCKDLAGKFVSDLVEKMKKK
jgi:ABC-type multidrug transport system fused ATPase/permease subunit